MVFFFSVMQKCPSPKKESYDLISLCDIISTLPIQKREGQCTRKSFKSINISPLLLN
jgi:hypothetical protein